MISWRNRNKPLFSKPRISRIRSQTLPLFDLSASNRSTNSTRDRTYLVERFVRFLFFGIWRLQDCTVQQTSTNTYVHKGVLQAPTIELSKFCNQGHLLGIRPQQSVEFVDLWCEQHIAGPAGCGASPRMTKAAANDGINHHSCGHKQPSRYPGR